MKDPWGPDTAQNTWPGFLFRMGFSAVTYYQHWLSLNPPQKNIVGELLRMRMLEYDVSFLQYLYRADGHRSSHGYVQ